MKKLLCATLCVALVMGVGCGGGEKPAAKKESAPVVAKAAAKPADLANGKAVYDKYCFACHMSGVAGAAALTNKPRWQANAAKKMDLLVSHVDTGVTGNYGTMPPKGTCMDCQEKDFYDAIHFMMSEAGVTPTY